MTDRHTPSRRSGGDWADHFSHSSDDYRRWRPRYPPDLFDWLASRTPARDLTWDCATGNGQAAVELASRFERVVATDASAAQIAEAEPAANVAYSVAKAEAAPLDDASADLVTVAQALHWFDVDAFHREVHRVLRRGGVVAEWSYGLASVSPEIDPLVRRFSDETVGAHWPPERALVDSGYAGLPFPFEVLAAPPFTMTARWSLDRFLGYLGTWSSVTAFRKATDSDPLPVLATQIAPLWNAHGTGSERELRWPLLLRVGRRVG